ncbi:MAG: epoxyqueuosine reductase QueH [Candidatus Electrothrix sp. YB6]
MRILLHVCCGPCTVYPLEVLRQQGHAVHGYFYNPNIHPFREFKRRIGALVEFSEQKDFPVTIDRQYGLTEYLRRVVFRENKRCAICYNMRLRAAARLAAQEGFDAFTTTLLYSRHQSHSLLIEQCEALAHEFAVRFHYDDFREGWQQGIDGAITMNLYRQPYCGCIYSEQKRYDKKMRKKRNAANK